MAIYNNENFHSSSLQKVQFFLKKTGGTELIRSENGQSSLNFAKCGHIAWALK